MSGQAPMEPNKVAFGRDGSIVSIHIHCADLPAALVLYRRLCDEAAKGGASLDIGTKPREIIDA